MVGITDNCTKTMLLADSVLTSIGLPVAHIVYPSKDSTHIIIEFHNHKKGITQFRIKNTNDYNELYAIIQKEVNKHELALVW